MDIICSCSVRDCVWSMILLCADCQNEQKQESACRKKYKTLVDSAPKTDSSDVYRLLNGVCLKVGAAYKACKGWIDVVSGGKKGKSDPG